MISDLVCDQPGGIFPANNTLGHKALKELRRKNLVQRQNCPGSDKNPNVIRRAIDNVRTLSRYGGNNKKIPKFFVLFIKRVDHDSWVRGIESRNLFVEQVAFAADFLVPDQDVSAGVGCALTGGERC